MRTATRRSTRIVDLTSSLYLGMTNPSEEIGGWRALTTGVPAVLREPPGTELLVELLQQLTWAPAVRTAPSTLHAAVDVWSALSNEPLAIGVDASAYPIARTAIGLAADGRDLPIVELRHFDPIAVGHLANWARRRGLRPVVLVDGTCTGCGRSAPVPALRRVLAPDGLLVIDDTQALGIYGRRTSGTQPYGTGGGGSLARWGAAPGTLVLASLAKAFGAPLAMIAGSIDLIARTSRDGPMRTHASPPSTPVVRAAARALERNEVHGDRLRGKLLANVRQFRAGLQLGSLAPSGGNHPVQRIAVAHREELADAVRRLHERGVRAVPLAGGCQRAPAIGAVLTTQLTEPEIAAAVDAIVDLRLEGRPRSSRSQRFEAAG